MNRRCQRIGLAASDGVRFNSCGDTAYLSIFKHRSRNDAKHLVSIWCITPDDECHVFCLAENESWKDQAGNYWSVPDMSESDYGTRGERVAFFPRPTNAPDPWHGYPLGRKSGVGSKKNPPDALIAAWFNARRINFTRQQRLLTGRW